MFVCNFSTLSSTHFFLVEKVLGMSEGLKGGTDLDSPLLGGIRNSRCWGAAAACLHIPYNETRCLQRVRLISQIQTKCGVCKHSVWVGAVC